MAFAQFNKTLPLTRLAAGSYVDGIFVPGAPMASIIAGSVQPAGAEDLRLLPEGRREVGNYVVYTNSQVLLGDRLTIDGELYEALVVNPWQNGVIPHYKVLVSKMQAANT